MVNSRMIQFNSQYRKKFEKKKITPNSNYQTQVIAEKPKATAQEDLSKDEKKVMPTNRIVKLNQRKSYDFTTTPNSKSQLPTEKTINDKSQFKKNLNANFAEQLQ